MMVQLSSSPALRRLTAPGGLFLLALCLCLAQSAEATRIIAIGDLHGDLEATRQALRLGGAIDEADSWIGGDLIVVQTGDQLDRGDDEEAILRLLDRLQREAAAAGGAVHVLVGNHELMNVRQDLRYVTEGGFADFAVYAREAEPDSLLLAFPEEQRGRVAAFRPGGPMADLISHHPVILVLKGNVFVHGGVLPAHLEYGIERLNNEVQGWLLGQGRAPKFIHTGESPTWARDYSLDVTEDACAMAAQVLDALGARRMIVGHTIQDHGVTGRCEGRVWCIDTGMAAHYGGPVQVLEIDGDEVRILSRQ